MIVTTGVGTGADVGEEKIVTTGAWQQEYWPHRAFVTTGAWRHRELASLEDLSPPARAGAMGN